jgi:hypothetical protein
LVPFIQLAGWRPVESVLFQNFPIFLGRRFTMMFLILSMVSRRMAFFKPQTTSLGAGQASHV